MSEYFDRHEIRNAFERIIILALIAIFLAALIISVANDIFAFVKTDANVVLNLSQGTKLNEIAKSLKKAKIINNPYIFTLFVRSRGNVKKLESFTESISLNSQMTYREIMTSFYKSNNN